MSTKPGDGNKGNSRKSSLSGFFWTKQTSGTTTGDQQKNVDLATQPLARVAALITNVKAQGLMLDHLQAEILNLSHVNEKGSVANNLLLDVQATITKNALTLKNLESISIIIQKCEHYRVKPEDEAVRAEEMYRDGKYPEVKGKPDYWRQKVVSVKDADQQIATLRDRLHALKQLKYT